LVLVVFDLSKDLLEFLEQIVLIFVQLVKAHDLLLQLLKFVV
jgi:hypothetical protein